MSDTQQSEPMEIPDFFSIYESSTITTTDEGTKAGKIIRGYVEETLKEARKEYRFRDETERKLRRLQERLKYDFLHTHMPFVRAMAFFSNEFYRIGRVLDAGAEGVIVPMVNSPEAAAAAVHAAKYPPTGGRSSGGARLGLFGDDYFQRANEEVLVAVMIETTEALAAVDEIAAVPGVDCLFIGPSDLSFSLGTERGSAEHQAAIARILEAADNAGVAPGIACGAVEDALRYADQGFRLVTCTSDLSTLRAGVSSVLQALGR